MLGCPVVRETNVTMVKNMVENITKCITALSCSIYYYRSKIKSFRKPFTFPEELGNLLLMRGFLPIFLVALVLIGVSSFVKLNTVPEPCANSETCISDLTGIKENTLEAEFEGKKIAVPSYIASAEQPVLGQHVGGEKRIFVDLTTQMLHAFEGDKLVMSFPVSTGKWGQTPTGDFRIWIKLKYTRMSGGNQSLGTYYNLPNVPHTMYFYNEKIPKTRGFGLHGAYWHNNFGHPMSHGCVNIGLENAEKLFAWAEPPSTANTVYATAGSPGTRITIYGKAPQE